MRNNRSNRKNYRPANNNSSIKILVSIILILVVLLFIESKTSDRKSPELANSSDSTSNVVSNEASDKNKETQNEEEKPKEDVTFTMAMTGDIMCHNTMYQDAYNSSDTPPLKLSTYRLGSLVIFSVILPV